MHHPSKLMTSLKGLLQYKVCILSNILSAFVLLPPPRSPKGSDLIYNILKWMTNYQAVLVQVQIKADGEKAAACHQYVKIKPIGMYFHGNSWSYNKIDQPCHIIQILTQFIPLISNIV